MMLFLQLLLFFILQLTEANVTLSVCAYDPTWYYCSLEGLVQSEKRKKRQYMKAVKLIKN